MFLKVQLKLVLARCTFFLKARTFIDATSVTAFWYRNTTCKMILFRAPVFVVT